MARGHFYTFFTFRGYSGVFRIQSQHNLISKCPSFAVSKPIFRFQFQSYIYYIHHDEAASPLVHDHGASKFVLLSMMNICRMEYLIPKPQRAQRFFVSRSRLVVVIACIQVLLPAFQVCTSYLQSCWKRQPVSSLPNAHNQIGRASCRERV